MPPPPSIACSWTLPAHPGPALHPIFQTTIHTPPPPPLPQLAIDLLTRDLAGEGLYPLDWALQVGTKCGREEVWGELPAGCVLYPLGWVG